jgi:hypothetical protein
MQLKNLAGALSASALLMLGTSGTPTRAADVAKAAPDWALNATAIEACSCPMFCQCYFNTMPAGHHEHGGEAKHYCRANIAYKVNSGHYGATKLDGAKFWLSSDLGGDFSKGQMEWAVLTFDKSLTKEQRDGIGAIAGQLFPVKWNSFQTAEGTIDKWEFTKDEAVALLDGGKTGEVRLKRPAGSAMTAEPVVVKNLKYWGAPRNDGFVLMPNDVEAYRTGPNAFEYKGTNGFMITIDMTSKDFASAKP